MEKYAIIKTGNKQYLVEEGQTLVVDKISAKDKTMDFDQILLVKKDGKVEIGTPLVKGVVKAEVVDQVKGNKIRVSKYKAKTGYHRTIGHRSLLTKVKIASIVLGGKQENQIAKSKS